HPTCSFKDRVVAVALSRARELGFDTVACASTGNLANSVAANAAWAWNSWDNDHPAEMVHLPHGLRVGFAAYAASVNACTRFPAWDPGVRLGPRALDGSRIALDLGHAGTELRLDYDKPEPGTLRGHWRAVRFGEWGLRFWVLLCCRLQPPGEDQPRSWRFEPGAGLLTASVAGAEIVLLAERAPLLVTFHPNLEALALTFSGRYQITEVEIRDQTGDPENADLNGNHRFDRFNPAGGLTYSIFEDLNLFGGYSKSFRAPTPAELTCADENDPCNLPNAFVADPPLDPVIGRTWEVGARGQLPLGEDLRWRVAFYRTTLEDDLIFAVTETGGAGFFKNIDETRRQGAELGLKGQWESVHWSVNYGFVDATYESAETLASVVEPDGIQVQQGDRIPGIPEHNLKAAADWAVLPKWSVGGTLIYASDQFLRGDDSNELDTVDDYATVNLRTRFNPWEHVEVWARIDNLFDSDYETGGTRNFNAFADPIAEERFLAPGAPRAGWVGVKLRF
ncbi:MAG: TonB-dependent receptor, partial [Gemmatimonadetes bacterium]|nr:TonB-dependent receptor [Gemmatimonadota bacterium]